MIIFLVLHKKSSDTGEMLSGFNKGRNESIR